MEYKQYTRMIVWVVFTLVVVLIAWASIKSVTDYCDSPANNHTSCLTTYVPPPTYSGGGCNCDDDGDFMMGFLIGSTMN